jgi:HK97 family phage major capsid protein
VTRPAAPPARAARAAALASGGRPGTIPGQALREERAKIAAEIRRLSDEGLAVNADGKDTEAWVKANGDYDALTKRIEVSERAEKVTAEQVAPIGANADLRNVRIASGGDGAQVATDEHRAMALQAWCRVQLGGTLTDGSGAAGGYLIPPETMLRSLEINMLAYGGMRRSPRRSAPRPASG